MTTMDLSDLDQAFDDADPETSSFTPVPDGSYQATVESVELYRSKTDRRMLKWCLKIMNPPHAGRLLWKYNGLETEKMGWLKGDLAICGLTLERLSELPQRLRDLLDIPLEIRVRNTPGRDGGTFTNVYFNRRLQFGEDDSPPPNDDDAPF